MCLSLSLCLSSVSLSLCLSSVSLYLSVSLFISLYLSLSERVSDWSRHTIQYLVDDEICYLSAASDGFPQRICFAFLEKLRSEYKENYQGHNKNQAFKKFLSDEMVQSPGR